MYGGNIYELSGEEGTDPYESLAYCESIDEIIEWYYLFMDRYFKSLERAKQNIYGREIAKAVEYINRNYRQELKLGDVANHIGMNESYLSHIFKKQTGNTFTDFVNNIRIKKAQALFRREDMNVQEVSELVGYANVSYFSRVFKQIVGVTPNEYRKTKDCY